MAPFDIKSLKIAPAPVAELPWTVDFVFRRLEDKARRRQFQDTMAAIRAGEISSDGFLQARYQDRPAGAIWIQLQPGHLASLWPPQIVDELAHLANQIARQLLIAAGEIAKRGGVTMIQALLETDSGPDADNLSRAGFEHLADLLYLVSPASAFPTSPPPVGELCFENFESTQQTRLAAIVERTYERTQDCPSLNGLRPIVDVIDGYQAVGDVMDQTWLIARSGERDVGCLLLSGHPEHGIWEIVYMGIVPEARGHGFGLSLARWAGWLARQARAERLVLAVDADNAPAIHAYAAAGFVSWDRRSVFVKQIEH